MKRAGMVPRRERPPLASRYELLVKIATGATATVYLGRRIAGGPHSFQRLVAVKRPHPHLVDDVVARRALREEAAVASRVHHANVVAVQDFEENEDDLLLVMDYVEGGSLAELLEAEPTRPFSPSVAVRIGLDVAEGLAAVHETADDEGRPLALMHRDVSPQNVLVGIDGTARLTDFGLARLAAADHSRTTGQVQGKIAYVSPEYVDGAPYSVQSEVFALGVVLWETVANRRLFRGTNEADTLRRILTAEAPPVSEVAPQVGPHLDAVLSKALEKDPSRRYATVRELALALERAARSHDMVANSAEVGASVRQRVGEALERRRTVLRASISVADIESQSEGAFTETVSMVHDGQDDVANEATEVEEPEVIPPSDPTAVLALPSPSSSGTMSVPVGRASSPAATPLPAPLAPAKVVLPAPLRVLPPPPQSNPNAARASRPPLDDARREQPVDELAPHFHEIDHEEDMLTRPLPKVAPASASAPSPDSTPTVALPALTEANLPPLDDAVVPAPISNPVVPVAPPATEAPLKVTTLVARVRAAFGEVKPPRPLTFVAIVLTAFMATLIVVFSARKPAGPSRAASASSAAASGRAEAGPTAAPPAARTATLSIEDLPGTTLEPSDSPRDPRQPAAARPRPASPPPARAPSERADGARRDPPVDGARRDPPVDPPSGEAPAATGTGGPPPNPYKNKR